MKLQNRQERTCYLKKKSRPSPETIRQAVEFYQRMEAQKRMAQSGRIPPARET